MAAANLRRVLIKPADDRRRRLHTCLGALAAGTDWGQPALTRLAASAAFAASGGPRTVNLCFQTTLDQNTAGRDLYRHGFGVGQFLSARWARGAL